MSKSQEANEVKYKVALKLLNIMLRNGLISSVEYEKIDELNRQTFSPELAKVYAQITKPTAAHWASYVETCVVVYVANRRSRPERKEKTYGKEDNKN